MALAQKLKSRYLRSSALGVCTRCLSVGYRLLAVPISVQLLTKSGYGAWLLMLNLVGWLAFSDLGLPLALQKALTLAHGRGDTEQWTKLFKFGWTILCASAVIIIPVALAAIWLLPIASFLRIEPKLETDFLLCVSICAVSLAISIPLRIGGVLSYASGLLEVPALTEFLGIFCSLIALGILWAFKFHSLTAFAICLQIPPTIVSAIAFGVVLRRLGLRLGFLLLDGPETREFLHLGSWYLLTTLGELLVLQTDGVLISAKFGPEMVPVFAIPMILFFQFLQFQNAFLRPLYPRFAHEQHLGNRPALRTFVTRCCGLSALAGLVAGLCLCLFGNWFITLWTHGNFHLPNTMAWGLVLLLFVTSIGNVLGAYANAIGVPRARFVGILVYGLVKVATVWMLVEPLGINCMPYLLAITGLVTDMPVLLWIFFRTTRPAPEPAPAAVSA